MFFFLACMPGLLHQTFALWVPWIGNTKLIMAQSLLSWAPQRDALLRWLLPAPGDSEGPPAALFLTPELLKDILNPAQEECKER